MNEEKRGRGRPKMVNGEARDCIFSIRLSIAELAVIKDAAEKGGVDSASDWARDVLLAAIAND
jgi:hypothetical protein